MAEAAIAMPVVLLILVFALNVSQAGRASMAARSAAGYGARVGAVAQDNPENWARQAALASLNQSGTPGEYAVTVQADRERGGVMRVTVDWRYPTILAGVCGLFGSGCPRNFEGEQTSVWMREVWSK